MRSTEEVASNNETYQEQICITIHLEIVLRISIFTVNQYCCKCSWLFSTKSLQLLGGPSPGRLCPSTKRSRPVRRSSPGWPSPKRPRPDRKPRTRWASPSSFIILIWEIILVSILYKNSIINQTWSTKYFRRLVKQAQQPVEPTQNRWGSRRRAVGTGGQGVNPPPTPRPILDFVTNRIKPCQIHQNAWYYCLPPQIFKPSYGPEIYALAKMMHN